MTEQTTSHFRLTAVRIASKNDGTYSVDPHGRLAALIPVRDRWGEIVDAVAFLPGAPGRWWLHHRDTVILGAEALAEAAWEHQPLELWETPEQWLLHRRRGAVVLDWAVDWRSVFEDVPEIICQSQALIDRLQGNFLRFGPRLTVTAEDSRSGQGVQVAERA